MKSRRDKQPCITLVLLGLMREYDDFITARELQDLSGYNVNQVSASLYHFLKYKIAEKVESAGETYYYLTQHDTRSRVLEERTPEEKPRARRRSKPITNSTVH